MWHTKRPTGKSFAERIILLGWGLLMMAASFSVHGQQAEPPTAPTPTATYIPFKAGALRSDSKGGIQVYVPAGCFRMGTTQAEIDAMQNQAIADGLMVSEWRELVANEQPAHEVCLTRSYWIDAYEVTFGDYRQFIKDGGYRQQSNWSAEGWAWIQKNGILGPFWLKKDSPAWIQHMEDSASALRAQDGVTWYESWAYAHWRGCRLPTEAEWEFAARGPQSLVYPWGNTFDTSKFSQSGYNRDGNVGMAPAGKSWSGAFDMADSACEWVNDWYDADYYRLQIRVNPPGPVNGQYRVMKGCLKVRTPRETKRLAFRDYSEPNLMWGDVGFRAVCEAFPG